MDNISKVLKKKDEIFNKIMSSIGCDGGASSTDGADPDPMTTAEMIYSLKTNLKKFPPEMIEWLIRHQDISGKWSNYTEDCWEVSMTSWAIIALSISKINDDAITAAIKWILSKQNENGAFYQSDFVNSVNTYATSYACLALYLKDANKYCKGIKRGIGWLQIVQNNDGGFGLLKDDDSEPSLTSYVAHCVSIISHDHLFMNCNSMKNRMIDYLIGSQKDNGAWTSWFESGDSIEGTIFSTFALLSLSYNGYDIVNRACEFIADVIDIDSLDNWIAASFALLVYQLEKIDYGIKETD